MGKKFRPGGVPVRKFSIFTTAAVSITAIIPATATAQWPGTTRADDHTRILEIGGIAFDRPGVGNPTPMISDAGTGETLFDSEDGTSVGGAAGLDIKYQFQSRRGRTWRFRSIVADFDTSNEVTADAGLASPLLPLGIETNRIAYDYDSRLLSFELMSCRNLAPGVNLVAGPRYISLTEEVRTEADGDIDFGNGIPTVTSTQLDTLSADNSLIGLQIGLEFTVPLAQSFYAEGFIRGGGFYNPTEVSSATQDLAGGQFIDPPFLGPRNTSSSESLLGEVGGRLFFDLVPDAISGYVGYEATWIDGIALAPAQLFATAGTVDTSNTLFYQGVTFGLRMKF
jgi:hypothetical protein